jgi:hypothetical protein
MGGGTCLQNYGIGGVNSEVKKKDDDIIRGYLIIHQKSISRMIPA